MQSSRCGGTEWKISSLRVLAPHIKIIDPAKEVERTADEALQMRGWRRLGKREGSFSFHESGEGPKQLKAFAERVFDIKIEPINLSKTS